MSDEAFDWIARSGKRAKGRRPDYFEDPAIDRLLERSGALRREDIERYVPDRAAGEERGLATKAMIARVMRGLQQELEAMEADDPPISEWVERLAKE